MTIDGTGLWPSEGVPELSRQTLEICRRLRDPAIRQIVADTVAPYRVRLRFVGESVTLSSNSRHAVDRASRLYQVDAAAPPRGSAEIRILHQPVPDIEFAIQTPYRLVLGRQDGKSKLFFGMVNLHSLRLVAGSYGDYETMDSRDDGLLDAVLDVELLNTLSQLVHGFWLHASSVTRDGRGVTFIGPSGAGKSTTAVAMGSSEFELLSDDATCLIPPDGRLSGFRLSARLRPQGREILSKLPGLLQSAKQTTGSPTSGQSCVPSLFLFLDGFAAQTSVHRLTPKEALWRTLRHLIAQPGGTMSSAAADLARLLEKVPAYSLRLGSIQEVVTAVRDLAVC